MESTIVYPRVTIQYCTQCKWLLRAAYFAQELLSTFSTSLGEVSLQPSTGGTFVVNIYHKEDTSSSEVTTTNLWDRKTEGGFPETKLLKQRVRNVIDPGRDLGHVDGRKAIKEGTTASASAPAQEGHQAEKSGATACVPKDGAKEVCEDCQ
ncbi:Rdx family-domain-containing protein [Tricharina praecox]|uniref:Rdx family-domain-containing protein n=1 Tax=Tricharina praecox TaxID=43433 RepID=UPI00222016BA|nr:Rdx family-domain-containing protein [Tricharina praecox]KAI5853862.1 Rdx family-domain-containing protein [Tricharina praecox]